MARPPLVQPVLHSAGTRRPHRAPPPGACDSHMHVFDPHFAPSPHWTRTPPVADVSTYRLLQARMGTERAVVVTPSTYGIDNGCTIHALELLGAQARGVAVVDARITQTELRRLHGHGVRGLRVNFVTPQSWGITTPAMLETIARAAAAMGWHVQIFAHPGQIVAMAQLIGSLPTQVVIDHLGYADPADGDGGSATRVIRGLLDAGNTWVKLSGIYMRSRDGAPGYSDMHVLGKTLLRQAPERLVWGSDWPHTTQSAGSVDDADLLDVLAQWCQSSDDWQRVLVGNPARLYGFD